MVRQSSNHLQPALLHPMIAVTSPTRSRTALLSRPVAFWMLAVTLGFLLFASSAPSPLYVVYQAEWHFSPLTLTSVFAVYVSRCWSRSSSAGRRHTSSARRRGR